MLLFDGVSSQVMGALTGGALLVAFALKLGASHLVIGLIAAVGPLTQVLQLPAAVLVEKSRHRKSLVLVASGVGRSFWVVVALIPWIVPSGARLKVLVVSLCALYGLASLAASAFNSWKRDLVPESHLARILATRLAWATAVGAAATLGTGLFIDRASGLVGDPLRVYSPIFLLGGLAGLLGVAFLGRMPEPRMRAHRHRSLRAILSEPLRDANFRKLLAFLASWNFAVNMAAPFFSVYMLSRLGLSMTWVMGLAAMSQVANVAFFRIWGRIADAISSKRVLSLAGSVFVLSIALWPFTTMPERYALTVPLLVTIHLLAGISTAGVNLCAGTITLKLAPRGGATAFLATNALTSGLAATLAPVLAGLLAQTLADDRASLRLDWLTGGSQRTLFSVVDLGGLDFLFVVATLIGVYALHRLLAVEEAGEMEEDARALLYQELRRSFSTVSSVAGLRRLTSFPHALLGRHPLHDDPAAEDDA